MTQPRVEIEDLAGVIRESMMAQQNEDMPNRVAQTVSPENTPPQIKLQPDFQPHSDHRYHINDLLRYHDRVFVRVAYRAVLKRSPDEAELLRDLKRLRSGNINKIDLLATLRYSLEGRAKGVELEGLLVPALVRRLGELPLLGYIVRFGIALARLPNLVRDQREFGGYVLAQNEQIADFLNQVSIRVDECRQEVSRLRETLSKQIETKTETLNAQQETLTQQQADLERFASGQFSVMNQRYDGLEAYTKQQVHELMAQLAADKEQLLAHVDQANIEHQTALHQSLSDHRDTSAKAETDLRAELARLYLQLQHLRTELTIQTASNNALSPREQQVSPESSIDTHKFDALYAALEDLFRGTREKIKENFEVYLPYVQELAPVVDLGCGRGEWLELLGETGIKAHGVDLNRIQIEQCRTRGFEVSEEDFVAHLRSLSDASVGAVTGFHIVEHVSLDTLITLFNETLRVLRPGGVAIFETPNPENVLVGSNYFYMDPTHRHPLPSELLHFLLESRGFQALEVLQLHPWDSGRVAGESEVADRFNAYFYGPMDYAIVGRKVGP